MNEVFNSLREILKRYSSSLIVVRDNESEYYLDSKVQEKGKPIFFGMVKILKDKVSFHLMPVYCNPSLLESISDNLRKRMQGKSCFNFKEMDETLLEELKGLTAKGFRYYEESKRI